MRVRPRKRRFRSPSAPWRRASDSAPTSVAGAPRATGSPTQTAVSGMRWSCTARSRSQSGASRTRTDAPPSPGSRPGAAPPGRRRCRAPSVVAAQAAAPPASPWPGPGAPGAAPRPDTPRRPTPASRRRGATLRHTDTRQHFACLRDLSVGRRGGRCRRSAGGRCGLCRRCTGVVAAGSRGYLLAGGNGRIPAAPQKRYSTSLPVAGGRTFPSAQHAFWCWFVWHGHPDVTGRRCRCGP